MNQKVKVWPFILSAVIVIGLLSLSIIQYENHKQTVARQTQSITQQEQLIIATDQYKLAQTNAKLKTLSAEEATVCRDFTELSTPRAPISQPSQCKD